MQSPSISSVLARLKQGTTQLHADLEALPAMRRLVAPDLRRDEYRDLLLGFYRSTFICEEYLLQQAPLWQTLGLDWSRRLVKSAWLEADLRHLIPGFDPLKAGVPRGRRPYQGLGLASATGCLYVLEGSTLGGRVIQGLLRRAQEQPAAGASRFFEGYGAATGERWATLGCQLEVILGPDAEAQDHAITAATETYLFLKAFLGDCCEGSPGAGPSVTGTAHP